MVRYDELDKMLRVKDVAEILHVHPNTLRRWSEQGRIGAYRIGSRGDRRFRQSDIASFIAEFNPFKQNER
jgi:excisionase family DNA binding protein